jgi:hypothetical protein
MAGLSAHKKSILRRLKKPGVDKIGNLTDESARFLFDLSMISDGDRKA